MFLSPLRNRSVGASVPGWRGRWFAAKANLARKADRHWPKGLTLSGNAPAKRSKEESNLNPEKG